MQPRPYDVVLGGKVRTIEQATKTAANGLDKYLIKQGKYLNVANKTIRASKGVTDALKRGGGLLKTVNPKWGAAVNILATAASAGITLLAIKTAEEIQEIDLRKETIRERLSNIEFDVAQKGLVKAKALQKILFSLQADYNKHKTNQLLINDRIALNLSKVRKSANDALYEVRAGRAKTEAQLTLIKKQANDALYEVRQGRVKIDANLQQQATRLTTLTTRVTTVETTLKLARPNAPNAPNTPNQNNADVVRKMDFPNLIRQNAQTISSVVEPYTAKFVDGKLESYKREFDGKISKKLDGDKLVTEIQLKTGQIVKVLEPAINAIAKPIVDTQLKPIGKIIDGHGTAITNILELFKGHNGRLDKAEYRLDKEGIDNDKQMIDLELLKKANKDLIEKYREQEKVNAEGNKKLDELLKWSLGIPPLLALIPRNTANLINPNIPNINQIGQAVRTNTPSTCRFSEAPIYDAANKVNNHSTALDVVQTGLITANTGIVTNINNTVNTINIKLGEQLTGGIAGKLVNGFKWLQLDRALAVLTFAATVQNHLMLSRDIGTTLLGAFSNVLSLIGLKDDNGQAFDLGSVINSSIENIIKGIVGAENYATLSEAWAKANRIYQATTNVINSFQNISNTILSGMELIGSYTGKIGNALKKSGEVLETAYGWMNPQPKFNRVTQTLQNLQNGASTIQQVTQAPLDVINAVTELQNANTELVKAIKEDSKPENKGIETPEPEKLKADELASKLASRISNILPDDIFNAAD